MHPCEPGIPIGTESGQPLNVDVALHRIDVSEAIAPYFESAQPENTGENPVSIRILRDEGIAAHLAGWPACDEHRARRRIGSDFRSDHVPSPWRALTATPLTGPVDGGRHGGIEEQPSASMQSQTLALEVDVNFAHSTQISSCGP